jgi:DNA-binding NtrC family response regulator
MKKRILVIDDDQALRILLQELLEEEAYEVETAIDGVDALAQLGRQREGYNVIVLDLTMPRLNGLQVLQKIQQHHASLLRAIIALSGDEEALQQAVDRGISSAMKKPFDLEALLTLVEQVIDRSEERTLALSS